MAGERLLRFTAPILYQSMIDIFSAYHIHPHDVHAILIKNEDEIVITLRFAVDFSQSMTKHLCLEQAEHPDEQVAHFFKEAAERCKSLLIAGYYKMMKQ